MESVKKIDNITLDVYAINYTNDDTVSVGELTVNVSSYLWLVITSYTFFMMSLYLFFVVLCIKLYNYTPVDSVNNNNNWKTDILVCDWGSDVDKSRGQTKLIKKDNGDVICDKNKNGKLKNLNIKNDVMKKSNSCGPKLQTFRERFVLFSSNLSTTSKVYVYIHIPGIGNTRAGVSHPENVYFGSILNKY